MLCTIKTETYVISSSLFLTFTSIMKIIKSCCEYGINVSDSLTTLCQYHYNK